MTGDNSSCLISKLFPLTVRCKISLEPQRTVRHTSTWGHTQWLVMPKWALWDWQDLKRKWLYGVRPLMLGRGALGHRSSVLQHGREAESLRLQGKIQFSSIENSVVASVEQTLKVPPQILHSVQDPSTFEQSKNRTEFLTVRHSGSW